MSRLRILVIRTEDVNEIFQLSYESFILQITQSNTNVDIIGKDNLYLIKDIYNSYDLILQVGLSKKLSEENIPSLQYFKNMFYIYGTYDTNKQQFILKSYRIPTLEQIEYDDLIRMILEYDKQERIIKINRE